MDFIIDEFYEEMSKVKFEAYGILDTSNRIHTLGTDSKIIGRIFEMFAQPVLETIAKRHGLKLTTPESQTVYPDFIMMENARSKNKIAVDIKTTYIDSDQSTIKFTLGSFGSYMRNNTKNIEYEYTDYSKHYVIGFIYKRNGQAQESQVFEYADRDKIQFPFQPRPCNFLWSELLSKQIKRDPGKSPHLGEILRIPLFQAFSASLFSFT